MPSPKSSERLHSTWLRSSIAMHGFDRAGVDAHVEAFLGQPQAHRRSRQHRIDVGLGGRIERRPLPPASETSPTASARSAPMKRPVRINSDATDTPTSARQEIAGADVAAAEPELDEGAVHPRRFGGDADVGGAAPAQSRRRPLRPGSAR